jgi:hypothetical protein
VEPDDLETRKDAEFLDRMARLWPEFASMYAAHVAGQASSRFGHPPPPAPAAPVDRSRTTVPYARDAVISEARLEEALHYQRKKGCTWDEALAATGGG